MKIQCKQCGALLAVTSPDAYISCPYCGAKAVVDGYSGENFLHRPALSQKDVLRLFESGSTASVSIYWFPFDLDTLKKTFTQPYAEMENYQPPSADRRLWNESDIQGTIVPVDPELVGDHGVLYHPFWIVISASTALGTIVDGVSGRKLGETADTVSSNGLEPVREAFFAFLKGVVPAFLVFFVMKGVSVFWASVFGLSAAVAAPILWEKYGKGSKQ